MQQVQHLADKIHHCCDEIAACGSELVVVFTPHGHQCADLFLVYGAGTAQGSALWDNRWGSFSVSCSGNKQVAHELVSALRAASVPCDLFLSFSESSPIELRWGEVVPLYFLEQSFKKNGRALPNVVIVSLPTKRLIFNADYQHSLENFSSSFIRYFQHLPLKTSLLFSADLAHTHPSPDSHPNQPLPPLTNGDPEIFDQFLENYIRQSDTIEGQASLDRAIAMFPRGIHCCGLSAFVILRACLAILATGCPEGPLHLVDGLVARAHPTYYGMMTAHYGLRAG